MKEQIKENLKQFISNLQNNQVHIQSFIVFGSTVTGKRRKNSDIDILILLDSYNSVNIDYISNLSNNPDFNKYGKLSVNISTLNLFIEKLMTGDYYHVYIALHGECILNSKTFKFINSFTQNNSNLPDKNEVMKFYKEQIAYYSNSNNNLVANFIESLYSHVNYFLYFKLFENTDIKDWHDFIVLSDKNNIVSKAQEIIPQYSNVISEICNYKKSLYDVELSADTNLKFSDIIKLINTINEEFGI